MLAISVQAPWSWLIVNAQSYADPKRVENRTWARSIRGWVLIHSGKLFDTAGEQSVLAARPDLRMVLPSAPEHYPRGGLVGIAEIVDCVSASDSPWFVGPYGFVMRNARPIAFVPWRGQLGFFNVPDDAVDLGSASGNGVKESSQQSLFA